jgi:hypothetical protein
MPVLKDLMQASGLESMSWEGGTIDFCLHAHGPEITVRDSLAGCMVSECFEDGGQHPSRETLAPSLSPKLVYPNSKEPNNDGLDHVNNNDNGMRGDAGRRRAKPRKTNP